MPATRVTEVYTVPVRGTLIGVLRQVTEEARAVPRLPGPRGSDADGLRERGLAGITEHTVVDAKAKAYLAAYYGQNHTEIRFDHSVQSAKGVAITIEGVTRMLEEEGFTIERTQSTLTDHREPIFGTILKVSW